MSKFSIKKKSTHSWEDKYDKGLPFIFRAKFHFIWTSFLPNISNNQFKSQNSRNIFFPSTFCSYQTKHKCLLTHKYGSCATVWRKLVGAKNRNGNSQDNVNNVRDLEEVAGCCAWKSDTKQVFFCTDSGKFVCSSFLAKDGRVDITVEANGSHLVCKCTFSSS